MVAFAEVYAMHAHAAAYAAHTSVCAREASKRSVVEFETTSSQRGKAASGCDQPLVSSVRVESEPVDNHKTCQTAAALGPMHQLQSAVHGSLLERTLRLLGRSVGQSVPSDRELV